MTRYHLRIGVPAIVSIFAAALAGAPQPATAQDTAYAVESVAVTGEPAPGTGGLSFGVTEFNDLNDSGLVTIRGSLGCTIRSIAGSKSNGLPCAVPWQTRQVSRVTVSRPASAAARGSRMMASATYSLPGP